MVLSLVLRFAVEPRRDQTALRGQAVAPSDATTAGQYLPVGDEPGAAFRGRRAVPAGFRMTFDEQRCETWYAPAFPSASRCR